MQIEELRAYCIRRQWDIVEEFIDSGVSGSKESRPALNRLLTDAKRRKFDTVLVYRYDRFARSLTADLDNVRSLGGLEGESYVDKDLRTLLGDPVIGPFNLSYCGLGSLSVCSDSLWQAIHQAADTLAAQQGQADPSLWRKAAALSGFVPALLPNKFPFTNRPTFQQVLELDRLGP
jgi:hypothetical protein